MCDSCTKEGVYGVGQRNCVPVSEICVTQAPVTMATKIWKF